MVEEKWHKDCGGIVVYQENPNPKGRWERAGHCLKCDAFPLLKHNIIFKFNDKYYEIFISKEAKGRIVELFQTNNFDGKLITLEKIVKTKGKKMFMLLKYNELPENIDVYNKDYMINKW
jgi:hypothetical protein